MFCHIPVRVHAFLLCILVGLSWTWTLRRRPLREPGWTMILTSAWPPWPEERSLRCSTRPALSFSLLHTERGERAWYLMSHDLLPCMAQDVVVIFPLYLFSHIHLLLVMKYTWYSKKKNPVGFGLKAKLAATCIYNEKQENITHI